jgi:hypothetical protein
MQRFFRYGSYLLALGVVVIIGYALAQRDEPVWVVRGNYAMEPLDFKLNHTNDPISKMLIRQRENAAEAVGEDGRTYFFNDPGDLILWLKDQPVGARIKLWVYTIDTHRWIDARIAWYGIRDRTVMGYGFGAREQRCDECISFDQMRLRMLHDETLLNPVIRKRLLEDHYEH